MSPRTPRLLLTSVFGPYGVDDQFGRKESLMELMHNQVTLAQGIASPRHNLRSFGLYFLAENIETPATVLDFPSRSRFIRELKKTQYDIIGISFITPNFLKAQEMARLIRKIQPKAKIILGGHGAAIEGVEKLIDCDHVVRGEGIRWLRTFLGENPDRPICHPVLPSSEDQRIFGINTPDVSGLLVPGVGCVNGCHFCATTHFFGKAYTPFFSSGEELYRNACRISAKLKTNEFSVLDENFLKNKERALEFLKCMERDNRPFRFWIFSSAETIEAFGILNLVRLGVSFIWIGAESKHEQLEKNRGRDLAKLIRELRDHGINVLASGILFLEHHTKENIQEDVEYLIGLQPDFTQFSILTPLPVTELYRRYKAAGKIDETVPYEEWHGLNHLTFHHPEFSREESHQILMGAFKKEFSQLSSSAYRISDTLLRGIRTLRAKAAAAATPTDEKWLLIRMEQLRTRARYMRPLHPTLLRFSHNQLERERVTKLMKEYKQEFGRRTIKTAMLGFFARGTAETYNIKTRFFGDRYQPKTRKIQYPLQIQ